ncbi:MAG: tetratricopeptide repeat protein [bacterium]
MLRRDLHMAAFLATLIALISLLAFILPGCNGGGDSQAGIERHKRLAGELQDTKLYRAAIEEYLALLAGPALDDATRANVNYLIGRIYFDDLSEYEQAAAYLVRARAIDPEGSFNAEASRKLVACLEKMGKMVDARRQLDAATDVNAEPSRPGDIEVARISGSPVWLSDVEQQIQALPPEVQSQFTSVAGKKEFVRQYIASELIYRAALREGFDQDPDIIKQQQLLQKRLLVDKYVVDKVMPGVAVDSVDIKNFYLAHKSDRYQDAPFDSVQGQVFIDYSSEKTEAAFSEYIGRLVEAEKVEFLDQNIK